MSDSKFSRGATIATILIGLGALVISALGYLASRPDPADQYAEAVAGVCAKLQAGRVITDSAIDARGRWQKDQYLVLLRQAQANNEQWRSDLAEIDPPDRLAAAHERALSTWTAFNAQAAAYIESLNGLSADEFGFAPTAPGNPADVTAASEALRGALAAIGAPERCGFSA